MIMYMYKIWFLIVYMAIKTVCWLFPHYAAYRYKYAVKARGVVFYYWITKNKTEEIDKLLSYLYLKVKSIKIEDDLITISTDRSTYLEGKITDLYIKNPKIEHLGKLRLYLSYLYWFWSTWIFLDDIVNVNGIDKLYINRIKNSDTDRFTFLVKNSRIYPHSYVIEANNSFSIVPYEKRLFSINNQTINNFIRYYGTRLKPTKGFIYHRDYSIYQLTIFKTNIVDYNMNVK